MTPGISPRSASPRKQMRHIWNLRRYARGRPQILQRFFLRTLNFGFRSIMSTSFAMLAPKRHSQMLEQRPALVVGARGGPNRHVEPLDLVDLVVIDLGEDDLLFDPDREIAAAVE